ncbi:hypothetical protein [Streptomyces sp. NPDC093149]|uniref:hypothetical protein n=1 Tax=Streptomyces sp. NPDC093149 TaxID=3366031 RepID=UPI0037FB6679
MPIDRPELGRPALVEVDVTGESIFDVAPVTRTEDRTDTGYELVSIFRDENGYHGRRYLPADFTHLRVTTTGGDDHRWSIRLAPLSAATLLASEHHGQGDEVLRYDGGPAVLTIQFPYDGSWEVGYVCQCLRSGSDCDCPHPHGPRTPLVTTGTLSSSGRATGAVRCVCPAPAS